MRRASYPTRRAHNSMTRCMAATTAACLVLSCAPHLAAQTLRVNEASTEVGVTAGIGQSIRRDLSASPLDFAGHGGNFAATFHHVTRRSIAEFSLSGGSQSLRSSSANSLASEHLGQGQFALALLRTLGDDKQCSCGISLGAALMANAMVTRHAYGDPTHRSSDFLFVTGGVGPAAAWRTRVSGGFFDARLLVPIASVVEHSYSVVNEHDAAAAWRFASPGSLRAATATIAFASTADKRIGVTWSYRAELLRYDDVQPVRGLTHSLSVGVVTRFGTVR
jgi:hypothetical protein